MLHFRFRDQLNGDRFAIEKKCPRLHRPLQPTWTESGPLGTTLRSRAFALIYISWILGTAALFVPLIFLPTFAIAQGADPVAASWLIFVIGGASAHGRVSGGYALTHGGALFLYKISVLAMAASYWIDERGITSTSRRCRPIESADLLYGGHDPHDAIFIHWAEERRAITESLSMLSAPPIIRILVDADACPVKDEIVRVAERHGLAAIFVSNAWMRLPASHLVARRIVAEGPDAADDWIADEIVAADICVTQDIPLAERCLKKGARALTPAGRPFTPDNIGMSRAMRDLKAHLRETGDIRGGPPAFARGDRSRFLQALEQAVQDILCGR